MPGTCPSGVVRPACSVMAVTVPIVSKKSASMIVKMVRMAASRPSVEKTLPMSKAPRVEKFGVLSRSGGTWVTPTRRAMTEVMTMLSTRAAGTLRTYRTIVTTRPITVSHVAQLLG